MQSKGCLEKKKTGKDKLIPEQVLKLEQYIEIKITTPLFMQLEDSGTTKPHQIVNVFGGNFQSLEQFICYNKPSLFLNEHKEVTRRLFAMSKLLLKKEFKIPSFSPSDWMDCKKTEGFNKKFMKLENYRVNIIKEMIEEGQYDLIISMHFNKVKDLVSDIAHGVFRDDDVTVRSTKHQNVIKDEVQVNQWKEEDRSTIESIPHNINIMNNDQYVTGRQHRNSELPQNLVQEYTNSLQKAFRRQSRRKSGFARAKSPYEMDFHPQQNENVKGTPPTHQVNRPYLRL